MVSDAVSTEDEYDLRTVWKTACQSFASTIKVDLRPGQWGTPEDVLAQLKLRRQEDEEKRAEFKVLKDVLGKPLVVIQNLGGIAASAAGMVPIPVSDALLCSQMCGLHVKAVWSTCQRPIHVFARVFGFHRSRSLLHPATPLDAG
jgi:hypothetical protein